MKRLFIIPALLASLAGCNNSPYCRGDPNGSWECWLKGKPTMGTSSTSGAPVPFTAPSAPMTRFCADIGPVACRNIAW